MKFFNDQVFSEIKERCLDNAELFSDETFSIKDPNIIYRFNQIPGEIEWKRAKDADKKAKFCEFSDFENDIEQGLNIA